jgi:hypothetical protein
LVVRTLAVALATPDDLETGLAGRVGYGLADLTRHRR